jgi:hypothetical protein
MGTDNSVVLGCILTFSSSTCFPPSITSPFTFFSALHHTISGLPWLRSVNAFFFHFRLCIIPIVEHLGHCCGTC